MLIVETEKELLNEILRDEIDFKSKPWPSISVKAQDLVKKMLTKNPKERFSAAEVLGKSLCFSFLDYSRANTNVLSVVILKQSN